MTEQQRLEAAKYTPPFNELTITKRGFYDDFPKGIPELGFGCPISFGYQLHLAVAILNRKLNIVSVELKFPERFFPHNASTRFWEIVGEYMEQGTEFKVTTSDLAAAAFIQKWDSSVIERPGGNGWETSKLPSLYGQTTYQVTSMYSF